MPGPEPIGGYCATCERDHFLERTEAAELAARTLMQQLEVRGSIEFPCGDTIIGSEPGSGSGNPRLSTDTLSTHCGQMFGVLVCRDTDSATLTLRAFSGSFNGESHVPGWAPPIHPARFTEDRRSAQEERITELGATIATKQRRAEGARTAFDDAEATANTAFEAKQEAHGMKRTRRSTERKRLIEQEASAPEPEEIRRQLVALDDQARHAKAELRRAKADRSAALEPLRARMSATQTELERLRTERRETSRRLMRERHAGYYLTNFQRATRPLAEAYVGHGGMPTGTGDCCAPKLLQLAAQRGLLPIGLVEFWWGRSPTRTTRRHGQFYAPCTDKCAPILGFMLCGAATTQRHASV